MSNIPKAREILQEGLTGAPPHTKAVIRAALAVMTREPPVRRAKPKRQRFPASLQTRIRAFAAKYPDKTLLDIANHFGIRNTGRVSDILNGKQPT